MTDRRILLLNSITDADDAARGGIGVCGSHGGFYAAYLASRAGLRAVIFNDAGGGLDNAGTAGVLALGGVGMAAAAASHQSCRIGDAHDMFERGVISFVNPLAEALGIMQGDLVSAAVLQLGDAVQPTGVLAEIDETRRIVRFDDVTHEIVVVDSASLVEARDKGRIVVTGSHGGLIGGDPARALKADAVLAVFNDAGVGCDNAGTTRLAALDQRGIGALTVAHSTARIGDAESALATGIVSAVNATASGKGIAEDDTLADALQKV